MMRCVICPLPYILFFLIRIYPPLHQQLIDAVAVHEERESALLVQEHRLRNEIENLKRAKRREDVPMEYLKNIMIKYLQTDDIEVDNPIPSQKKTHHITTLNTTNSQPGSPPGPFHTASILAG